jgi:cyclic beta-1,2-glucan synthetase
MAELMAPEAPPPPTDTAPSHPELFSQEQLEAHAEALARTHRLSPDLDGGRPLLARLERSARSLDEAYRFLSNPPAAGAQLVGSEEWLRDNHHVVQDQVREIRRDLPKKYYAELPKLADGESAGYPRVYLIARELITHTAGRLDLDTLVDFTVAYQRVAPLSMGETWAIAIMLRVALVEELRRLADGVVLARRNREQARQWVVSFGDRASDSSRAVDQLLEKELETNGRLSAAFVVELLQWLRDQPSTAAPAWQALQRALQAQGTSPEEMLRAEHQREAADQLAIGNVITSMRLLSSIDWPLFFDRVGLVEQILRQDPAGAYIEMDFPTRDRYRHSVEQLAKGSKRQEGEVARLAVAFARAAQQEAPDNDRRHHVGYYLISRGRFGLEKELGYPPIIRERLARFVFRHPVLGYLSTIAATVAASVASLLLYSSRRGGAPLELWIVALVALIPVSELAISLLNLIITSEVPPRQLPKLEMRHGIPARDRTMVVVPVIVDSVARVESLLDDLEVRFLANRDPHLHFALLSDFADADQPSKSEDAALVAAARQRVDDLNTRHGVDRFYLFHRDRHWNPQEQRWMGWERKRGKLEEFNRLLRGAEDTSFAVRHGDLSILPSVRYVITLDSDTQLPLQAGRRLVGTLSHPLNRPRFDARVQRVTEGYGVLQPRVAVSLVSANRTAFSKVFSGHVGVDPYTTAVSDVYQDLFHEGSYVGKGIYDVEAFQAALKDRVPENALLSHDLFEGSYARAGLCTDIHLVDDYPAHYLTFAARQHRWARGDWQIARWVLPKVPDQSGRAVPNTLPVMARWKILDNLRRSLIPPSLLLLLVAGWTLLPGSSWVWTLLALLVLAFPVYTQLARSLGGPVPGVPFIEHLRAEGENIRTSLRQAFLSVALLAHQSVVMVDAIARALVRMVFTHRHLLEWVSADRAEQAPTSLARVYRRMWTAPVIACAVIVIVASVEPGRLLVALPVALLWMASPALAYATGRPLTSRRHGLSRRERLEVRKIARRIWLFFEELVGPADHWLVPDNYQEDRRELIAHRTSPTNIGLQLLSALSAHDFGYVSLAGVLDRIEPTFDTLLRLPRYRGHFYNWYDTQSLLPLAPPYISTVDSGNLAGYLLTLRSGLGQIAEAGPIIGRSFLNGLEDMVALCSDEIAEAGGVNWSLRRELSSLRAQLHETPATLAGWRQLLPQIADRLSAIGVLLHEMEEPLLTRAQPGPATRAVANAGQWLERTSVAVGERQQELDRLAKWTEMDLGQSLSLPRSVPSLTELVAWCHRALADGKEAMAAGPRAAVEAALRHAEELIERAERLAGLADDLIEETELEFLFNSERQLFSIGLSVSDGRLDNSYYDILASEARLASFMAIATGKISHEHWFKLGRSLTPTGGRRALLSWSASMFEYLMPLLVMRVYPGTLLDETYNAVVARQIQYGAQRGVPWGVSESAYFAQDLEGNYQYRAFGVPGLGLKRGLADDLVIAPYAAMLAAPLAPAEVVENLKRLRAEGMTGRYGFYEAIDYTAERLPPDRTGGYPLPTYMAHHQGMSLLSLDNLLNGSPMQNRFHADPRVQAADLLLQERVPHLMPLKNPPIERADHVPTTSRRQIEPTVRRYVTPQTRSPRTHLLSNGSYSVMVTNAGGGYSRRQNLAMTRWREDITTDAWGSFCYVRDLETGEVWSTTHQPTGRAAEEYEATFAFDRAVWRRLDSQLEIRTEVVVSPEDDVELRRVSITNHSPRGRTVELTSYAEVVLAPADADLAHPAFSNLFVETVAVPERDALICVRRPRSGTDHAYLIHVLSGRGRIGGPTTFETDRARFIGRGRTIDRPAALFGTEPLSNTTGAVLDPIVSLRQSLRLPPGGTARLAFTTGYADSEEGARRLIEKYHDRRAVARALALASTHSQVEIRHLGLTLEDTMLFQRLAGRLLYGDPRLRLPDAVTLNQSSQRELWKHGISGDVPILLARLSEHNELQLFRELLKAHEYLRGKGFLFDLVILNMHGTSYRQDFQDALQQIAESGPEQSWIDRPGGVFLRRADLMTPEDQVLLGHLQVPFDPLPEPTPQSRVAAAKTDPTIQPQRIPTGDLEMFNGFGGFAEDGREYLIDVHRTPGVMGPVPWSNVVAYPRFGFAATESGPGCTWSENSHDNRLTPWQNDPVRDPSGEAVFIRDEESGRFWSATPLPSGEGQPYLVRHGQGYSTWQHTRDGIESTLRVFAPIDQPVKLFELTLRNTSSRPRRFSVTLYVEWVLGENRTRSALQVVTSREPATGAVMARNAFRDAFADRVAFLDLYPGSDRTITGDRSEFIGRNGTLGQPAAMTRVALSNRTGAALDPCGAVQVQVTLAPNEERTTVGMLGEAGDLTEVRALVQRYRDPQAVASASDEARGFWDGILGTLVVKTPDRALDLMLNRWLLYQALSCRIWGRSAFYQSSGAFGFRDQLQDVLALLLSAPQLARQHLVRAASRQFVEGDVQHWWHEPDGQGVRTRCSDDRLWLAYATLQYVNATGDRSVLDELVPFLQGRPLNPDEDEAYERPSVSHVRAPLYEHCVRAVALNLETGPHGLPLIGTCDWNDGMNLVGREGRGESVWLGWFLYSILGPFADLAASCGEPDRAESYRRHRERLAEALEQAWDGAWYRRAYFDDGTPLGSASNKECQIDAIAQSWAVLSGCANPARAQQAMQSTDEHLVRRSDGLVLLLTPPFDRMTPNPGYIQGYLPGIRENGGQYTHAALWTALAWIRMGEGGKAGELLSLMNPINHARTSAQVERYRTEPYVVAADVYSHPAHTGRGGWTWYTGSAAWMYRVGVEGLLGISLHGGALRIDPCIPPDWPGYQAHYKSAHAEYQIAVENPDGVSRGVRRVEVDGVEQTGQDISIAADDKVHQVRVVLGRAQ